MSYLAKADRRASIIAASIEVLKQQGFSAFTARAVAAALGSSPGQVHHHFTSTTELVSEAWREYARAEIASFYAVSEGDSPAGHLEVFFANFTDSERGDDLRMWSNAWSYAQLEPGFAEAYNETFGELEKILARIVEGETAEAPLALKSSAESFATRMLLLAIGLAGMSAIDSGAFSAERRAQLVQDSIRAELGAG